MSCSKRANLLLGRKIACKVIPIEKYGPQFRIHDVMEICQSQDILKTKHRRKTLHASSQYFFIPLKTTETRERVPSKINIPRIANIPLRYTITTFFSSSFKSNQFLSPFSDERIARCSSHLIELKEPLESSHSKNCLPKEDRA